MRLFHTIASTLPAIAAGLLLAACASTPLDNAPVSDASAASTAAPGSQPRSAVAPVTTANAPTGASGPAGAANTVFFDYDSASIRPEFQPLIDAHAKYLGSHRDRKLMIAGHTDERGGREYNLALGQQRAEAVRRALELLGARGTQVESVSYGEEKPADAGHDEAAWSHNRRADLTYR
jgi:peptidoglycan-associated lipoprotein